jgi:hypothetical protein
MGKSTIYKWPFSIAMLNYQRVNTSRTRCQFFSLLETQDSGLSSMKPRAEIIFTCHWEAAAAPECEVDFTPRMGEPLGGRKKWMWIKLLVGKLYGISPI